MKNIFIAFLFALAPFSLVFGQQAASSTAGSGKYECEVDCLFTSCSIKCDPDDGAANCGCWFGFAQCTCIGTSDDKAVYTINYEALETQQSAYLADGNGELAGILGEIGRVGREGGDISGLIELYKERAGAEGIEH